ncbi:MAG: galactofuranosyltransferase [Bacteroidales bacterium]|nr:galactofuranosyltransferase [Bacteroidales bacterium]
MLCYIAQKFPHTESADFKARTDMDAIMASEGFRNVGVRNNLRSNRFATRLARLGGVLKAGLMLHRGDTLFVQYPDRDYTLICRLAHLRGAKVVTLVHCLESLQENAGLTPFQEVAALSQSNYIIALNEAMERWLGEHGSTVPSTSLGIWDYLSHEAREARQTANTEVPRRSQPDPVIAKDGYTVMFAGGVSRRRNQFLYDWGTVIDGYKVVVFGNNFDLTQAAAPAQFRLRGFVPSGLMIRHPEGDFGLVWDGCSIDSCNGQMGEYLRYNNPHKASLYIRCGAPVIVWKHSGLAPFVEAEGIGFTIESLDEISARLRAMTPEEYTRMKDNVGRISARLATGSYFRSAIARANEALAPAVTQMRRLFAFR